MAKAPGFDAQAWFQKLFDEQCEVASSGKPALRAAVPAKMLGLLAQYRLKLPLAVYQERLVQAGGVLFSLGECAKALAECYAPILSTAAAGGLAARGLDAVRLKVQADFGSVEASAELLRQRDPMVHQAASTATMRQLLARVNRSPPASSTRSSTGSC